MAQIRQILAPRAALEEEAPDRCVWFRASTPYPDRHGTVIASEGIDLRHYQNNPVVIWSHAAGRTTTGDVTHPEVVIGRAVAYRQTKEALDICVEFDTDPFAELCYQKVKRRFLNAVSIGAVLFEDGTVMVDGQEYPFVPRAELWELSLVICGSNPQALRLDHAAPLLQQRQAVMHYLQTLDAPEVRSPDAGGEDVPPEDQVPATGTGVGMEDDDGAGEEVEIRAAYSEIDFGISEGVREELERGLGWVKDGLGGDGLTDGAKRDARKLLSDGKWWPQKVRKANAFFARHGAQEGAWQKDGEPTPKRVAWALWGGDPGESQVGKLVKQMDAADERGVPAVREMPEAARERPPLPYGPTSVMICLYPTPEQAQALALTEADSVTPAEIHLTLVAMGKQEDLPEGWLGEIQPLLRGIANATPPLLGNVAGFGRFGMGDAQPFVALPNVPGLVELREHLCRELAWRNIPYKNTLGFIPHMTLRFLHPDEPSPPAPAVGGELSFSSLALVFGGTRYSFDFAVPDRVEVLVDSQGAPVGEGGIGEAARAEEAQAEVQEVNAVVAEIVAEEALEERALPPIDRGMGLPWPDRYLVKNANRSVGPLLTAKVEKPMALEMSEYKYMVRRALGYAMEAAEMQAMLAEEGPEEYKAAHRATAIRYMEDARGMIATCSALLQAPSGEGALRAVPTLKDAELQAMFNETCQALGALPKTERQVCRGMGLPEKDEDLENEILIFRGAAAEAKELRAVQAQAAQDTAKAERERLIAEHLKSGDITPAEALTIRGVDAMGAQLPGGPWSPARVEGFVARRQALLGKNAAVSGVRMAGLTQVETPAGQAGAQGGASAGTPTTAPKVLDMRGVSLQQGQVPKLVVGHGQRAAAPEAALVADLAQRLGIPPEKILAGKEAVLAAVPGGANAEQISAA